MNSKKIINYGLKFGLLYLIFCLPAMVVELMQPFIANILFSIFAIITGILINLLYLLILCALLIIGKENLNKRFVHNIIFVIVLVILLTICSSFLPFIHKTYTITNIAIIFSEIFLAFMLGLISVRLSTDFLSLQDVYGESAKKAAKWSKISGWIIVTVILSPLGSFLLLICNYYEWRIIQQRSKNFL